MSYDGSRLDPIFHSETCSSHLLFDIFNKHKDVAAAFIKEFYGLDADIVRVFREKPYPNKGKIDLFITFDTNDHRCALLIEAKVHDYSSVTDYQISTYYNAVLDDERYDEIYFIYLTQFNERTDFGDVVEPKSLVEATRGKELIVLHNIERLNFLECDRRGFLHRAASYLCGGPCVHSRCMVISQREGKREPRDSWRVLLHTVPCES
ncbi:MAG: hypothetical protein R6V83_05510 [Candidatus Thorarchaeota archaeon]